MSASVVTEIVMSSACATFAVFFGWCPILMPVRCRSNKLSADSTLSWRVACSLYNLVQWSIVLGHVLQRSSEFVLKRKPCHISLLWARYILCCNHKSLVSEADKYVRFCQMVLWSPRKGYTGAFVSTQLQSNSVSCRHFKTGCESTLSPLSTQLLAYSSFWFGSEKSSLPFLFFFGGWGRGL
jgi:hypothetical protein